MSDSNRKPNGLSSDTDSAAPDGPPPGGEPPASDGPPPGEDQTAGDDRETIETDSDTAATIVTRPTHLGHVHLKVRDLTRALEFYTEVLALDVEEHHGRFAFLTFGQHHHDVALQELPPDAPGPNRGVGLYHAAFEVETKDALASIFERLQERGISATPVDHRISKALYFSDPDGNGLEVYLDTREETDRETWDGENRPFDPTKL